jgi:uncharacterized repeat protein (TIGR01451 family)
MGGMWKLAAMSAVIGAGLVVVWQAQLGLNQNARDLSVEADVADNGSSEEPTPALQVPDGFAAGVATVDPFAGIGSFDSSARTAKPSADERDSVNAPPNAARAQPIAESSPPPVRYQRGVDFNQRAAAADSDSFTTQPSDPAALAEHDPFSRMPEPALASQPAPARFPVVDDAVRTADAAANEHESAALTPVAAQIEETRDNAPTPDPLFGAAPPEFDAQPAPSNNTSSARGNAPDVDSPLSLEQPPNATPQEFDPFTDDRPKRIEPAPAEPALQLGPPAQSIPERTPQRLPLELDEVQELTSPRAKSTRSSIPATIDTPQPAPALDAAAPRLQRLKGETSAGTPARATPSAVEDSLLGDGQVTAGAPRGVQEPRLTIEKVAPSKAVLGQELIYSVIVKNIGGSPASQVTVEDRIPKGARLIGTAPRAELIDKRLIWKLGTLKPRDQRKISIKVVPEEEGSLGSVAKVNFVSEVAAEIVITAPQLKLRVSAPSAVRMGEKADVLFTITNTGDGEAKNVMLRSVLPEGLQHPSGSDLEYFVGDLAPKYSREVPLELTAVKPGQVTQRASITGDGNVHAEAETAIEVIGEQLVLTRRGQAKVFVGRPTVYANTVGNEGARAVSRVKVIETVPVNFEFVDATSGGRYDADTRTITWTVGPVAPGAEETVSTTLVPKTIGQYDDTVTATGPTGSVATVQQNIVVEGFPSLAVESLEDQRLLAVGEQMTSQIQLRNRGSAPAGRVALTVLIPDELRVVSAKGPSAHQVSDQRLVFDPIDSLPAKDIATYEIVLEGISPGDSRLELQIAADHLRRPVKHEEAVQIVGQEP